MGMESSRQVLVACAALLCISGTASAQVLGTFRWQQQPYCNIVTLNIVQAGSIYHLDGVDDQCGAGTAAAISGLAFPNPDGTIGFGMTIVTSPNAAAVHLDATVTLPSPSGTWRDSSGQTGPWTFLAGVGLGGSPRPAPAPVFVSGLSAGGSTVTNVGAPVNATDATNKAYVDARAPKAFYVTAVGVTIPAGAGTTTVLTLNLPAGRYFVMARGEVNNNDSAPAADTIECNVRAGGVASSMARNMFLAANAAPGESETAMGFLVHSFAAAGQAVMDCSTNVGWVAGNVIAPQLTALSVQP